MEEPRKYIMDRFQEHLHTGFETFCARHGVEKTDNLFITFLIDQDLISKPHLQRFTVLKEFEKICAEQRSSKTLAVDTLANRFRISERTVWSILRRARVGRKKLAVTDSAQ